MEWLCELRNNLLMSAELQSLSTAPHRSSLLLKASVGMRRWIFLTLLVPILVALIGLMVATLSRGGFDALDAVLTVLFAITLPWTVIGFLNAFIGLIIMRSTRDPALAVCPVHEPPQAAPIEARTALVVCVRNEDVDSVHERLDAMLADLSHRGIAQHFHAHVLSDSNDDAIVREEAEAFEALAARWREHVPVFYRRRLDNRGYKAGNIREFVERAGDDYDFMLVLDADSVMTAVAIERLVRIMQANPRLGILQSLINGLPATSGFARIFQFGMRLGMRSYTIGSAWWQGDCGPYWGHNALIRVAPFREHCELPAIDRRGALGGEILSHDQVEAVLMRRAGFDVRVLADAGGSFEENPASLVEFVRRDLRWCLGNMQYVHLLALPGLRPVSRAQLLLAILMFVGSPAWMAFVTLGALRVGLAETPTSTFDPSLGIALFAGVMGMVFAPKIATVIHVALDARARRGFGGLARLVTSVLGEIVFSTLLAPIMAIAHTRFLAGLPFGRTTTWAPQRRGAHRVRVREAWRRFWPQTACGAIAIGWIAGFSDAPLWSVLPIALGPLLVVPFTIATAASGSDALARRLGLWQVPEEIDSRSALLPPMVEPAMAGASSTPALASSTAPRARALVVLPEFARRVLGIARSLWIYYGDRRRAGSMDALYRPLVPRGSLAFDIGSHVGDRAACFRRLGARVLTVEPQRGLARVQRLLFAGDPSITVCEAAVGARDGEIEIHLNTVNPTVTSASLAFIAAAAGAAGWQEQQWTATRRVPLVTLDALIARHGRPSFVKIDVEGFEAEVLAGLSEPVPALSFEFTTIQRGVAIACLHECERLGDYRFNAALGESQRLVHAHWLSAVEMSQWLLALPHEVNSGDVYARLTSDLDSTTG